jgi:hypothetical protein
VGEVPKPLIPSRRPRARWTTDDLPEGATDERRWRKVFVPTFIHYVAQQNDPWGVRGELVKPALQIAWDNIYPHIKHQVKSDGPVFHLVRIMFLRQILTTLIYLQANQRVSDTWRSSIGSTGLLVVNMFIESQGDTLTDEDRQRLAAKALKDLKFLYSNTESGDPKVSFMMSSERPLIFVSAIQRHLPRSTYPSHLCSALQCD